VLWKLEGQDDADLRRAMLPSGNTLLGLVKHLATWEYAWICRTFGYPTEALTLDEGDDTPTCGSTRRRALLTSWRSTSGHARLPTR